MMMWLSIPITNIMNECIFSWKMVELVVGLGIPLHEERSSRLDCSSSRGYPSAQGWHVGGKSWLRSGRHTILDNTFQRLKAITGFLDNVHDDSAHRGLWSFSFIMATFLPMQLCTQAQMHSQGQKGYRTGLWWDGCVDREVEGIVFDKICSSSTPEIGRHKTPKQLPACWQIGTMPVGRCNFACNNHLVFGRMRRGLFSESANAWCVQLGHIFCSILQFYFGGMDFIVFHLGLFW